MCLQRFNLDANLPKVVLCRGLHDVCAECETELRRSTRSIRCPVCRDPVEEKLGSSLPRNRGMIAALEELAACASKLDMPRQRQAAWLFRVITLRAEVVIPVLLSFCAMLVDFLDGSSMGLTFLCLVSWCHRLPMLARSAFSLCLLGVVLLCSDFNPDRFNRSATFGVLVMLFLACPWKYPSSVEVTGPLESRFLSGLASALAVIYGALREDGLEISPKDDRTPALWMYCMFPATAVVNFIFTRHC